MASRQGTILLVDDEPSICYVAERMLELEGHTVVTCASAEEALRVFEAHEGRFDLLLSDIHLEGMSGPALAAELRRRQPGIGVILTSGYTVAEAVDKGMTVGTAFLGKPYLRNELAAAVRAHLPPGPAEA